MNKTDSEKIKKVMKQQKEDAMAYYGIDNFDSMYEEYLEYITDWDYKAGIFPDDFEDYFFEVLFL